MTKFLWLILPLFLSGFMSQPVANDRFIEKKQVVYSGNTFVGKLKFVANSYNGSVIQVSQIAEDSPQTVEVVAPKDCPSGYSVSNVTLPKGQQGAIFYTNGYPVGSIVTCDKGSAAQIHQIEVPVDDVEQVIAALLHFRKELKYVERVVIEEEK